MRHPYEKTEADHLEMMKHPDRWPVWPLLPLRHRTRRAAGASGFSEMGFMSEDGTGKAKPRVYIGLIYFHSMGQKLEDLPFEDYATLEEVVTAGWKVD